MYMPMGDYPDLNRSLSIAFPRVLFDAAFDPVFGSIHGNGNGPAQSRYKELKHEIVRPIGRFAYCGRRFFRLLLYATVRRWRLWYMFGWRKLPIGLR